MTKGVPDGVPGSRILGSTVSPPRFLSDESMASGGGPIQIAEFSGAAARRGVRELLFFMALISLNLFLINLLPIPILDGGQILILAVESTLRRDLSLRLKERLIQVGRLVIVTLMAMALYFDLVKTLPTRDGGESPSTVSEP